MNVESPRPERRYSPVMKQSIVLGVLVGSTVVAVADPKTVDLAAELKAIAAKFPPPRVQPIVPVASPACTAPTAAERADARKRAFAWIDTQHPDEAGSTNAASDDATVRVNVGCKDAAGAIVLDISQDRGLKKKKEGVFGETRRNYLVKVTPTAIDVLAEDVSTSSAAWSEWADEGRISLLGQLDVDGDGALDVVYSDHEHEGGSIVTYDHLKVRFSTGKISESGTVENLSDVRLAGTQLVVSGATRNDAQLYVCLGADLHLSPCAAAKPLQATADKRATIDRFAAAVPEDVPDRDQLAQDLAALGITGKRKTTLLAAASETDRAVRVARKVNAFLVKANLIEPAPMPDLILQTHAEAQTYLDGLATKLGDTACTATPLTADDKTKATAWVKKQDEKAQDVEIAATTCGPYVWVGWWPNRNDNKRRQALLGRDGTRIVGFTFEPDMPGPGLAQVEHWFTHDGTIVGVAIGGENLWVIANGKAVATTKGDKLAFYRADDRFSETSASVFLDGGVLWHATPTGRERLDLALVKDHEARRAAIALLSGTMASSDAKYLAALSLLGADKALIAEAKKLP